MRNNQIHALRRTRVEDAIDRKPEWDFGERLPISFNEKPFHKEYPKPIRERVAEHRRRNCAITPL